MTSELAGVYPVNSAEVGKALIVPRPQYEITDETNYKKKKDKKDKDDRKQLPLMKYTSGGVLNEAVEIAGVPGFVSYINGKLELQSEIEEPRRIIIPMLEEEPAPYRYASIEELQGDIRRAYAETPSTLFKTAKELSKLYCDISDPARTILAGNIISSYMQDRIGLTHYLLVTGFPGTGKGTVLEYTHQVAYRAVMFASARAASVYRTLGTTEPGQATLLIDEANNLEENVELQEVLKTGYKRNGRVPRVLDASSSVHTSPTYFCTFGFKILAMEKKPVDYKAASFLSRTLSIQTFYGKPPEKIDLVVAQHQNNKRSSDLYTELTNFRKLLFAYRLIHYSDPLPEIKLNIDGRPEELCLPLLQMFKDGEVEKEILGALNVYVIEALLT